MAKAADEFKAIRARINEELENMAKVKCKPEDYLDALRDIDDDVSMYIEAARDDVRRAREMERDE